LSTVAAHHRPARVADAVSTPLPCCAGNFGPQMGGPPPNMMQGVGPGRGDQQAIYKADTAWAGAGQHTAQAVQALLVVCLEDLCSVRLAHTAAVQW
jgi:hypothetical protein